MKTKAIAAKDRKRASAYVFSLLSGIDFTKLRFGQNCFGQSFSSKYGQISIPK
jgi:hypothetical protein